MKVIEKYQNLFCFLCSVFILIISLFVWSASFTTQHMTSPDAYDYAQMGNELAENHRFSSRQVFPRHIPYLLSNGLLGKESVPNLYRYPMPTLSNALAQMLVTTDIIATSVIQSGFWFFASAILFFLLTRKLSGNFLALVATLFYLSMPDLWLASRNGMPETLAIFFILLTTFGLATGNNTVRGCLFIGFCCGITFLTKTQFVFLLPAALLVKAIQFRNQRVIMPSIFVVMGFLMPVLPWCLRNFSITGNALFSFSSSRNLVLGSFSPHSDLDMQMNAPSTTGEVLQQYSSQIYDKYFENLAENLLSMNALTMDYRLGIIILFATAVYLFAVFRKEVQLQWLYCWVIICLVANVVIVSLAFHKSRFYLPMTPLIILLGLIQMTSLKGIYSAQLKPCAIRAVYVALLVLACVIFFNTIIEQSKQPKLKTEARVFAELNRYIDKESVIMSNVSHKVALYTSSLSVRLPAYPGDLLVLAKSYGMADYVLLTDTIYQARKGRPGRLFETYDNYATFLVSNEFLGTFDKVVVLSNGWVLYKKAE